MKKEEFYRMIAEARVNNNAIIDFCDNEIKILENKIELAKQKIFNAKDLIACEQATAELLNEKTFTCLTEKIIKTLGKLNQIWYNISTK